MCAIWGFDSHKKLLVSGNVIAPHPAHKPGLKTRIQGEQGYQQGTIWNDVGIVVRGQRLRNTKPRVWYPEAY